MGNVAKEDCESFWLILKSLPWVDAKPVHEMALKAIERNAVSNRDNLNRAAEAAAELDLDLPSSVNFEALTAIVVTTQICREIQGHFKALCTQRNSAA